MSPAPPIMSAAFALWCAVAAFAVHDQLARCDLPAQIVRLEAPPLALRSVEVASYAAAPNI